MRHLNGLSQVSCYCLRIIEGIAFYLEILLAGQNSCLKIPVLTELFITAAFRINCQFDEPDGLLNCSLPVKSKDRRMIQMKKFFTVVIMSATLLPYSQLSYAEPFCLSVCDDNYDKCVANVINLPEPRTYEEQETLQACYDTRGDCQHSCEDTNKPPENQQKQDEGN